MKRVEFSAEAEAEFTDAAVHYERARPGYGVRFRNEVYAARETIATYPEIGERIPRTPCRRFILTDFPFALIYLAGPELIEVVALAHHKRRPGYWKSRLRKS